jgi:hypothetical protein
LERSISSWLSLRFGAGDLRSRARRQSVPRRSGVGAPGKYELTAHWTSSAIQSLCVVLSLTIRAVTEEPVICFLIECKM